MISGQLYKYHPGIFFFFMLLNDQKLISIQK